MTKHCGCLGCRNEAVGTIPKNGVFVWVCEGCAETRELIEVQE